MGFNLKGVLPKRLKIWHKLALACLAFALPIAALVWALVAQQNREIEFGSKELRGTEYLRPLKQLLQGTLAHQIAVTRHLNKDEAGVRKDLVTLPAGIEESLRQLDAVDRKYGTQFSQDDRVTADLIKAVKESWDQVKNWKKRPQDQARDHAALVGNLRNLISLVGDTSNLILDPDLDSYYMMDAVVLKLPEIQQLLGTLGNQTIEIAATATPLAGTDRNNAITSRAVLLSTLDGLKSKTAGMAAAFRNDSTPNQTLEPTLRGPLANLGDQATAFAALYDDKVIRAEKGKLTPAEALQGSEAMQASFELWDKSVAALDELLNKRVNALVNSRYVTLAGVAVTLVLALALVFYIVRGFTSQLDALTSLFVEVDKGNFQRRCEVRTQDELGDAATELNKMLDNTLALIQSRDEKDQIQRSITKLLDEVADVAVGDLRREAEVTADMTGAIADSFNYMLAQLRKIIGNVTSATKRVTSSARDVATRAEELAAQAGTQTENILHTSAAVEQMAVSIQQVSETANQSADVAKEALVHARQGNETVKKTIQGMGRIRDQVQETAKRIKRLGESSQEIGQIVQIINDIADRTSILALNASIQAAMAGEAGRGFAVVAEEVERLADRSTDATKKIAGLVMAIQSETQEAVSAMEKGIQEVVDGSTLANQAGRALSDIESNSSRLAELLHAISSAASQQASASDDVARSMSQISRSTEDAAQGTRAAASTVNELAELAESLRASVSQFKLPETSGHGSAA